MQKMSGRGNVQFAGMLMQRKIKVYYMECVTRSVTPFIQKCINIVVNKKIIIMKTKIKNMSKLKTGSKFYIVKGNQSKKTVHQYRISYPTGIGFMCIDCDTNMMHLSPILKREIIEYGYWNI